MQQAKLFILEKQLYDKHWFLQGAYSLEKEEKAAIKLQ